MASYYEHPPNPAVTAMDTYTWQALTTGRVTLPDETIPARVWFRLLRTLIDEITDLPADPDNMRAAPAAGRRRVYARPAPNRTTGNPTKAWTATPKTEPCKPPQPSSPRYKTAPSPDTAPPHTCSEPPPTAGPAICTPLLTNMQRTSENDRCRRSLPATVVEAEPGTNP